MPTPFSRAQPCPAQCHRLRHTNMTNRLCPLAPELGALLGHSASPASLGKTCTSQSRKHLPSSAYQRRASFSSIAFLCKRWLWIYLINLLALIGTHCTALPAWTPSQSSAKHVRGRWGASFGVDSWALVFFIVAWGFLTHTAGKAFILLTCDAQHILRLSVSRNICTAEPWKAEHFLATEHCIRH